jgi:hypothetical protein
MPRAVYIREWSFRVPKRAIYSCPKKHHAAIGHLKKGKHIGFWRVESTIGKE